jgi:cell division transport system permease protein
MIRSLRLLTFQGVRDVFRQPFALVLTILAIVLVTVMGGAFLIIMHNLDMQFERHGGQIQFQVYWQPGTPMDQVQAQWDELQDIEGLVSLETFTPGKALEILSQSMQTAVSPALSGEDNPLPATALAEFRAPHDDVQAWGRDMHQRLGSMPRVAEVHFNPVQLETLSSWVTMIHRVFWPSLFFFGLIVALAVGNAIKLSMVNRREEIEILRLVGAGRWYVQYPLMVGGALQGLLGGVLALGVLKALQLILADALNFPPLWIKVHFLTSGQAMGLLGGMVLVGMLGSLVGLKEY